MKSDERQAEKGKTEHSTARNSIVWTVTGNERRPTVHRRNCGSVDGMVECAVGVLTMSEDGDGRPGQRYEPADSDMVERDHAAHETP